MSKISDTLVVTAAFRVGSVLVTTRFASCLGFFRVESMLLLTLCIVALNHFSKQREGAGPCHYYMFISDVSMKLSVRLHEIMKSCFKFAV